MAPTSDERRELARKLREAAIDDGHVGRPYGEQGFQVTLRRIIGTSNPKRSTLYARLADLIDPTCKVMEVPDNDEFMVRVVSGFVCKRCGHEAIVERNCDGSAEPPRFCPCCGARVTSGGEG